MLFASAEDFVCDIQNGVAVHISGATARFEDHGQLAGIDNDDLFEGPIESLEQAAIIAMNNARKRVA